MFEKNASRLFLKAPNSTFLEFIIWIALVGGLAANAAQIPQFTTPVPVTELNSQGIDWAPWISPDGLELYFASDRDDAPTMHHIYHSTRSSLDASFTTPVRVTEINHPPRQLEPYLSGDGLTMYFNSYRSQPLSDASIWAITRPSVGAPWNSATQHMLAGVNTPGAREWNGGAQVTSDGLRIYFHRGVASKPYDLDLCFSSRNSTGEDFGPPTFFDELNTTVSEAYPYVTSDGLMLFFTYSPDGRIPPDLYVAVRDSTDQPFSAPVNLWNLNTPAWEFKPFYHEPTQTLYFTSSRADGRGDIYRSQLITTTPGGTLVRFGVPENVTAVNTDISEGCPYLTLDGLSLYFSRGQSGQNDIYVAVRSSTTAPFGSPSTAHLDSVNTSQRQWPDSLSADQLTLYLHSDTRPGSGSADIWVATRPDVTSDFSGPRLLPNVNSTASDFDANVSADGLSLYFVSSRAPQTPIWVARRNSTAEDFGAPTNDEFAQIHSHFNFNQWDIGVGGLYISPDERTLYIYVEDDVNQSPSRQLWVSTRSSKRDPFGPPGQSAFVNIHSGGGAEAPSVSRDGNEIFFGSGRSGGQGSDDIWRATRETPGIEWSTYLGGSGEDGIGMVVTGPPGNIFVSVNTDSADFPFSPMPPRAMMDVAIVMFNAAGLPQLGEFLPGNSADYATGLATDPQGNLLITGFTWSTDLATTGAYDTSYNGGGSSWGDAFVAKMAADGTLLWCTYLGGSGQDYGWHIATDTNSNIYLTGMTDSADFPTSGPYGRGPAFDRDSFVAKFSPDGRLLWSTYLGGNGEDLGYGVAPDNAGNVYVGGRTTSTDFPTTGPNSTGFHGGGYDGYIAKFSANGMLLWSTCLGGSWDEGVADVLFDKVGSIYVTGGTSSADFPTSGAGDTVFHGSSDAFLAKFGLDGWLQQSSFLGGGGWDANTALTLDRDGNLCAAGVTDSADFPTTGGGDARYRRGGGGAILAKFDHSGRLIYSTIWGGSQSELPRSVAADAGGGVYVVGQSSSSDFPTTRGWQMTYGGGAWDGFITKFAIVAPGPRTPAAPSNLKATAMSDTRIDLSWADNSDNEEGSKIERKVYDVGLPTSWAEITTVTANVTTYQDVGVSPCMTYLYRVRAFNAAGDSPYSNETSATAFGEVFNPPNNLTATPVSMTQINLSWIDDSDCELGFKIEGKTGLSGTWSEIAQVGMNVMSYQDTGLSPNTTYYYRVRAFNLTGHTGYSNEAWATTPSGNANLTLSNCDIAPMAPVQLRPGDALILSAFIENLGDDRAGPFWTEVWGSRTGGLTLDRFVATSLHLSDGLPGNGAYSWITSSALYSIPDGPYTVVYAVDRPREVAETNERDNRAIVRGKRILVIRPQTQVDLAVEGFAMSPNPAQSGQPVAFSGRVVNRGAEPSGPFWIEFWGSWDWPYPNLNFFLCDSIFVWNLDPGAWVNLSDHPRQLCNVPTGVFLVGCVADRDDSINELDETNNYQFVDGQVFNRSSIVRREKQALYGPDIAVVSADISPASSVHLAPGDTITLTVELTNQGTAHTDSFWLEYWGSRDGGLTLNDFLTISDWVTNLAPGATVRLSSVKSLCGIPDGPYSVVVFADRPGDVTEADETNNRCVVAGKRLVVIRPAGGANLVIEQFQFGIPCWPGIEMHGIVRNTGTADSGPFWVEFRACPGDPDYPWPDRFVCDSIHVDNLAPGGTLDLVPYRPDAYPSLPAAQYVIIGFVDRPDQVAETDETDNYAIVRGILVLPH